MVLMQRLVLQVLDEHGIDVTPKPLLGARVINNRGVCGLLVSVLLYFLITAQELDQPTSLHLTHRQLAPNSWPLHLFSSLHKVLKS